MNSVSKAADRSDEQDIARQILLYLEAHPQAQDTLEGIVGWWLLERKIRFHVDRVKNVLDELVLKELIIEQRTNGQQSQYRANTAKNKMIREIVSQARTCKSLF